jgi:hypothetical protein
MAPSAPSNVGCDRDVHRTLRTSSTRKQGNFGPLWPRWGKIGKQRIEDCFGVIHVDPTMSMIGPLYSELQTLASAAGMSQKYH